MQVIAKAADSKGKRYRFIASTPNVDRAGDTVQPNWDLDSFRRTGMPILWAHDHQAPPIGYATWIGMEGKNLVFEMEFAPRDKFPRAAEIQDYVDAGLITCTSVGFRPVEWTYREPRGMDIQRSELLEISLVSVPMNAEAVLLSKGSVQPACQELRPRSWLVEGCDVPAVCAWFKSAATHSKEGRFVLIKAVPPAAAPAAPAADPGPGPADDAQDAATVDQIIALMTPKPQADGTTCIPQADYDKAMGMLNELKVALGGAADPNTPADPNAPAAPPVPPAKGLTLADVEALITKRLNQKAVELPDDFSLDEPENESLEVAFEDMGAFSQTLG